MSELDEFARLVVALKPWRPQLVFVGGWAHRLYRQHPLANPPAYAPLLTKDADVAFADTERLDGSIREALTAAGFQENLLGEHRPPVSQYALGDEGSGFYAEFLTPLKGSGLRRSGAIDATVAKAGITAQKLRNLDLLLVKPWQVDLTKDQSDALEEPASLWIPNPVSFMIQKVLIHHDRRPDKRPQDVLYIHDTLELFGAQLAPLSTLWKEHIRGSLADKQKRQVAQGVQEMFSDVTDVLREAARIPQDRRLTPERMQMLCAQGFGELLNESEG